MIYIGLGELRRFIGQFSAELSGFYCFGDLPARWGWSGMLEVALRFSHKGAYPTLSRVECIVSFGALDAAVAARGHRGSIKFS